MYSYFFFSCVTIKCLSFCFILDSLRHVSDLYFALLVSPPLCVQVVSRLHIRVPFQMPQNPNYAVCNMDLMQSNIASDSRSLTL